PGYNVVVSSIRQIASADFPTRWGKFRIMGFEGDFGTDRRAESAVALVMGDVLSAPPLVRIHSQCLTVDVFGSLRCDCRSQLEMISVRERVPCEVAPNSHSEDYLKTKKAKMVHLFSSR